MADDGDGEIVQRRLAEVAEHEGKEEPAVFVELEEAAEA